MEVAGFSHSNNALVGVLINGVVIYNILLEEPEFSLSGLSIIKHLREDTNEFVSTIVHSQSYDGIEMITDDKVVFSSYLSKNNTNIETFSNIRNFIKTQEDKYFYTYFYIIDYVNKLLVVKIPDYDIVALDYNCDEDILKFKNSIREISRPKPERDF